MFVSEIMTVNVDTITPKTTLKQVQSIFDRESYHHLLVVEAGKLVGVISDRDMLRLTLPDSDDDDAPHVDEAWLQQPASEFMTTALITIDRETLIDCASILLLENNISCLPVVDLDNCVEGILTWKDLLKYYVYVSDQMPSLEE